MKTYKDISDGLENKRNEFYKKLRQDIYDYSSNHLSPGFCALTVRDVLEKNGFSIEPICKKNIYKTINKLKILSEETTEVEIITGSPEMNMHTAAQVIANASQDEYVVLALLANFRYPEKKLDGCHHVGFVIKNKLSDNPLIGQGGMKSVKNIFKPASWSFSWNWENAQGVKNKYCMIYVKYGLKVK